MRFLRRRIPSRVHNHISRRRTRTRRALVESLERRDLLTCTTPNPLDIFDAVAVEGDAVEFLVALNELATSDVTFEFSTGDGSATHGNSSSPPGQQDYLHYASGVGKILAGMEEANISIPTFDDSVVEGSEDFTLTITSVTSNDACVVLGDAEATGTINDDDAPGYATSGVDDVVDNAQSSCSCECVSCDASGTGYSFDRFNGNVRVFDPGGGIFAQSGGAGAQNRSIGLSLTSLATAGSAASEFSVIASFGGQQIGSRTVGKPLSGENQFFSAIPIDVNSIPSGQFLVSVAIDYTNDQSQIVTDTRDIPVHVERSVGELSNGWSYSGVQRLWTPSVSVDRLVLSTGSGSQLLFDPGPSGIYLARTMPSVFAEQLLNGDWEIRWADGGLTTFNSSGLIQQHRDRHGNITIYSYVDANSDSITEELDSITLPTGVVLDYVYDANGVLQNYTDDQLRTWTYGYDTAGRVSSVTGPDPDGGGPLQPQVWTYGYDASDRITSVTQPGNQTRHFVFNPDGTIDIQHEGGRTVEVIPQATRGYASNDKTTNPGSAIRAAAVSDGDNHFSHTVYNRDGLIIEETDANGISAYTQRHPNGLPFRVIAPSGENPAAVTDFRYDTRGNLTEQIDPDGAIHIWRYETSLNFPTRYTDPLGRETIYTLDPNTGDTTQIARPVQSTSLRQARHLAFPAVPLQNQLDPYDANDDGIIDLIDVADVQNYAATGTGSIPYPDVNGDESITSADAQEILDYFDSRTAVEFFQYSQAYPGQILGGLLMGYTDPVNTVTQYQYDWDLGVTHGKLLSLTEAYDDLNLRRTTHYEYNDNGWLSSVTDPLGNQTFNRYDAVGRLTATREVVQNGSGPNNDTIGLYDPVNGQFHLKDSFASGNSDHLFSFGPPGSVGWQTLTGDWNGEGHETIGLYDPSTSFFHLKDSLGAGNSDHYFQFGGGGSGWIPLAGDWNGDGVDTIGLYQPDTSFFHLKDSFNGGVADYYYQFGPGNSGWIPLVGDWNGDGVDTVGLYQPDTSVFHLKDSHNGGSADHYFQFGLGGSGWTPLTGDWDNNGIDTIGFYQPSSSTYHLKDALSGGGSDHYFDFGPGNAGWLPLIGDWDASLLTPTNRIEYDLSSRIAATIDPLGRETNYHFDGEDRLTQVIAPLVTGETERATWVTEYNNAGRVKAEVSPMLARTEYEYDDGGRLTDILLPDPVTPTSATVRTTFGFTDAGLIDSITDARLAVTEFDYDDMGRVRFRRDPVPDPVSAPGVRPVFEAQYDLAGRPTTTIDARNSATDYKWDDSNNLAVTLLPSVDGVRSRRVTSFDDAGRENWVQDEEGNLTSMGYDKLGRLDSIVRDYFVAGGQDPRWDWEYDANDRLTREQDSTGVWTEYSYDSLGRLTEKRQPNRDGVPTVTESWQYDVASQPTSSYSLAEGNTSYTYDEMGRLISTKQVLVEFSQNTDIITDYGYDLDSRLDFMRDPDGRESILHYDGLDRLTQVLRGTNSPDSVPMNWTYDLTGNLTSETDGEGNTYTYTHDDLGRRKTKTTLDGDVTEYTYYLTGQMKTLEDQSNNVTEWLIDERGRVTDEIDPSLERRLYEYDKNGDLTKQTDRDGRYREFEYDSLRRLRTERWYDENGQLENTLTFEYDFANRLTEADDPQSAKVERTYDSAGHLDWQISTAVGYFETVSIQTKMNAADQREQASLFIGATGKFTDVWRRDSLGRVDEILRVEGLNPFASPTLSVELGYYRAGQLNVIDRFQNDSGVIVPVAQTVQTYDLAGRLTQIAHFDGAPAINTLDYTFYPSSERIHTLTQSAGLDQVYTYTAGGQLEAVSSSDPNLATNIQYGNDGNRSSTDGIVWSHSTANELNSSGNATYTYDEEGRRVTKTVNGELTTYTWDQRGRLTEQLTVASGQIVSATRYRYDALDRRVAIERSSDGQTWDKDRHVYDKQDLLVVLDDAGVLQERFLHGPLVDQILAEEHFTGTAGILWPLTDHLGSIRDVAMWDNVNNQTLANGHIEYDAFGREISVTGTAADLHFGYTGRDRDVGTDLQFNRARYYDAAIGRWISQDPIGFAAGDANLYRYVENRPTTLTDPSGLEPPQLSPEEIDEIINTQPTIGPLIGPRGGISLGAHGNGLPAGAYGPSKETRYLLIGFEYGSPTRDAGPAIGRAYSETFCHDTLSLSGDVTDWPKAIRDLRRMGTYDVVIVVGHGSPTSTGTIDIADLKIQRDQDGNRLPDRGERQFLEELKNHLRGRREIWLRTCNSGSEGLLLDMAGLTNGNVYGATGTWFIIGWGTRKVAHGNEHGGAVQSSEEDDGMLPWPFD